MKGRFNVRKRRLISLLLVIQLLVCLPVVSAMAFKNTTLRPGMKDERVRQMQEALIKLGYLGGTPDGVFGTNTENAVRKFQRANHMTSDGLAGLKTLKLIYEKAGMIFDETTGTAVSISGYGGSSGSAGTSGSSGTSASGSGSGASDASGSAGTQSSAGSAGLSDISGSAGASDSSGSIGSSGSLFSGDYSTMRIGSKGNRVKSLQKALISLGFLSGKADGKFGKQTQKAVTAFQKANKLKADGLAGKKTLKAIEKACSKLAGQSAGSTSSGGQQSAGTGASSTSQTGTGSGTPTAAASVPSLGSVKLLHWFNDVKPSLRTGQQLLIVDPQSGISWTLKLYSLGRHADAEPLTAQDTANMKQAFGGKNTWNQKAVYVRLPSGVWTIGSTHDMPHMSGSISDNNFNGHLCVHFLRDMDECKKNDPNYGVSNQETIRNFWKSLTGEIIN